MLNVLCGFFRKVLGQVAPAQSQSNTTQPCILLTLLPSPLPMQPVFAIYLGDYTLQCYLCTVPHVYVQINRLVFLGDGLQLVMLWNILSTCGSRQKTWCLLLMQEVAVCFIIRRVNCRSTSLQAACDPESVTWFQFLLFTRPRSLSMTILGFE